LLNTEQPDLRIIQLLGELHETAAIEPLLRLLANSDAAVRAAAAVALGELRHPHCAPGLMVASCDPDYAVRTAALDALAEFGPALIAFTCAGLVERGA
jgi:HEAT repeat protein